MNKSFNSSHKMKRELDKSLGETQEDLKKLQDVLRKMRYKNVHLSKEYMKAMEFCYSII